MKVKDVIQGIPKSHPSRVRGLKLGLYEPNRCKRSVAPFTGAWIEIEFTVRGVHEFARVAPFTGAWIEIN